MEIFLIPRRRQLQHNNMQIQSRTTTKLVMSAILVALLIFIRHSESFHISTPIHSYLNKDKSRCNIIQDRMGRHTFRNSKTSDCRCDKCPPLFGTYNFSNKNNKGDGFGRDSSSSKGKRKVSSETSTRSEERRVGKEC